MRYLIHGTLMTLVLASIAVFGFIVVRQPVYSLGMGLVMDQGVYQIYAVVPGSTAWRAGISVGDRITAVDYRSTAELMSLLARSEKEYLQATTSLFNGPDPVHVVLHDRRQILLPVEEAPVSVRLRAADRVVMFNVLTGFLLTLFGGFASIRALAAEDASGEIHSAARRFFLFSVFFGPAVALSYFHSLWSWPLLWWRFVGLTVTAPLAILGLVSFGSAFPKKLPSGRAPLLWIVGIPPGVYGILALLGRFELIGPGHYFVHGYVLFGIVTLIAELRIQYRLNNRGARRRLRWVFLGAAGSVAPYGFYLVSILVRGSFIEQSYTGVFNQVSSFFLLLFPVSIGVGLTRFDVLDVDELTARIITYVSTAIPLTMIIALLLNLTAPTDWRVFYLLLIAILVGFGVLFHDPIRQRVETMTYRRRNLTQAAMERVRDQLQQLVQEEEIRHLVSLFIQDSYHPQWVAWVHWENDELQLLQYVARDSSATPPEVSDLLSRESLEQDMRVWRPDSFRFVMRCSRGHNPAEFIFLAGPRRDGDIYTRSDQDLLRDLAIALDRRLQEVAFYEHTVAALEKQRALTADKDELLQEVHHRVKNNLQVIISLLSLQMQQSHSDQIREELPQTRRRIYSMAMVHESSYQSANFSHIRSGPYLGSIISSIYQTGGDRSGPIRIETDLEDFPLPVSLALPCGMVLSELFSNALRYGDTEKEPCTVTISFRRQTETGELELSISDSGPGLPDPTVLDRSSSGGFMVAHAMAAQARGTLEYLREGRSRFVLRVPGGATPVGPTPG